jgi:hypothetical protein
MRRNCASLVGFALLTGSCSTTSMIPLAPTNPTVMAFSGSDSVPLNTRVEVHDAFGKPTRGGIVDGTLFEEFQIRGGCDRDILGYRVPAFEPLEEFHVKGWGDLQLTKVSNVSGIPTSGNNLIIVASVNNVLHFEIFDNKGNSVIKTDETKLTAKAGLVADLKKQLENVWPPNTITEKEKEEVITAVGTIVGHVPVGSFELGVANMKPFGMGPSTTPTGEGSLGRQRILPGQTLRFEYERSGKVINVYRNGELLLSPTMKPDTTAKSIVVNKQ